MNGHARRCREAIEELGFRYDAAITAKHNNGKAYYTHQNQPDQPLTVYGKMNEQVSRVVIDRARQIAGLSMVGAKRNTQAIKDRRRLEALTKKQREERERADYERRSNELGALRAWADGVMRRDRDRRAIEELMRPGRAR